MKKTSYVLFISFFIVLVAISTSFAKDYAYSLLFVEENTTAPTEPTPHEDYAYTAEDGYAGYNYYAKFRLPDLNLWIYDVNDADDEDRWISLDSRNIAYNVSWDLISDFNSINIISFDKDESSDIMILSGLLPDSKDIYDYTMYLTATVTGISNENYSAAIGSSTVSSDAEISIAVDIDSDHSKATPNDFATYIVSNDSINIEEVTSDYEVTIATVYDNMLGIHNEYIESDDDYRLNLPQWLTYTVNETEVNDEFDYNPQVTSLTIKFNPNYEGIISDGEKAVVRVPLIKNDNDTYGVVLGWNVVYSSVKFEPFVLSDKTLNFTLEPGNSSSKQAAFTGAIPSSEYTSSNEASISSDVKITAVPAEGKISVTAEALDNAKPGTYETVLTFTDIKGNADKLTVKITVKEPPAPPAKSISINGTKTFQLDAGSTATATLTASGDVTGKVIWTFGNITPSRNDLVITHEDAETSTKILISSETTVPAGTYTVSVSAVDEEKTSASATLIINVKAFVAPIEDVSQDITEKDAVKKTVSALHEGAAIDLLPENAYDPTQERTSEDVKNDGISLSEDIKIILPLIKVTETKIYLFNVPLQKFVDSGLKSGNQIFIYVTEALTNSSVSNSELYASSNTDNAMFIDDNGNELTRLPSSDNVYVAAYLEANKDYSPVITTPTATSSSQTTKDESEKSNVVLGSPSGTCNIGLYYWAMTLLAIPLIRKKY